MPSSGTPKLYSLEDMLFPMASSSPELSIIPPTNSTPFFFVRIVIVWAHESRANLPIPFLPIYGRPLFVCVLFSFRISDF